jgi:hypothetical protein
VDAFLNALLEQFGLGLIVMTATSGDQHDFQRLGFGGNALDECEASQDQRYNIHFGFHRIWYENGLLIFLNGSNLGYISVKRVI